MREHLVTVDTVELMDPQEIVVILDIVGKMVLLGIVATPDILVKMVRKELRVIVDIAVPTENQDILDIPEMKDYLVILDTVE